LEPYEDSRNLAGKVVWDAHHSCVGHSFVIKKMALQLSRVTWNPLTFNSTTIVLNLLVGLRIVEVRVVHPVEM
jgi:hypothetical protein